MASTLAAPTISNDQVSERTENGLDVDWLIHKKGPPASFKRTKSASGSSLESEIKPRSNVHQPQLQPPAPAPAPAPAPVPAAPPLDEEDSVDPFHVVPNHSQANGTKQPPVPAIQQLQPRTNAVQSQTQSQSQSPSQLAAQAQLPQTPPPSKSATPQKTISPDEAKHGRLSSKKDSRKPSWFSSLGSKLSGSDKSSRSNSVSSVSSKTKSPQPSPSFERGNPLDFPKVTKEDAIPEEKPTVLYPRRPSVLVAAGTETKLDTHPGFLTSALRRLSSGNTVTLGKAAGTTGALCPRKVMNIDHHRQRTHISDFDQNKLRRVAFKVDVEIAGVAAQADEQDEPGLGALTPPTSSSAPGKPPITPGKDTKMAKFKDRSEGATLKKTTTHEEEDAQQTKSVLGVGADADDENKHEAVKKEIRDEEEKEEAKAEAKAEAKDEINPDNQSEEPAPAPALAAAAAAAPNVDQPTTTRKKEKKKRSEAERKERKEKKRRQAEANGLVPLELLVDDDSESSNSNTPPGASTPRKGQPTTDPLRIYKRCCQLRETIALATVKEQITKPSATLAEAPGTVASIDLSGTEMSLQDIQTLGDWLAVVPVRRLILDDCNLSDEAVRIVLSALVGCKSQDQIRANRKLPRWGTGKSGVEQMGIIERLSLKNNTLISVIGWRHIALFIHLCRSLRTIDLSGIAFPASASGDLSRTSTTSTHLGSSQELPAKHLDLGQLFARALSERFGKDLEELILSACDLSTLALSRIIDSVIKCRIKRLGLAKNHFNEEAVTHVVRYVTSGFCEGLDMGGNDLNGLGHLLTEVLDEHNPLFAISLADCNLSVDDIRSILQHLSLLKSFKFIDLSRNHELFEPSRDAVSLLRRRLPNMKELKRIHLTDVGMTPNQLISLAEIFPDCPSLAHVSILDNQRLIECLNSKEIEPQEEACAFLVSLMTAVRASKTLVAVEMEVPSQESSEVIKALASQVVAYSLRNLERTTLSDIGVQDHSMPDKLDKQAPEVLLHLVGHMDGYSENHDNDEPAPDEDYIMATSGIVKALGVCLGNKETSRINSRNISPAPSGTATPRSGHLRPQGPKKPKDVSLDLCESARKIRLRLRPAMVKEDRAGNADAYRRLLYLDQTLERTIKRFEDEYPESRPQQSPTMPSLDSRNSSYIEPTTVSMSRLESLEEQQADLESSDVFSDRLLRTASNTSLASRALTQEEGRMLRFGQHLRREVIKPTGQDDLLHGTSVNDASEPEHLAALRLKLENFHGEDIRKQVELRGPDDVIKELGLNAQELMVMEKEDPQRFESFKSSQLAAQINAGMTLDQAEIKK